MAQNIARTPPPGVPPEDKINLGGIVHESKSEWVYLRGAAKVQTSDYVIYADEVDYNSDTAWAYARGHVRFEQYVTGEKLNADHVEYNLKTEEGKFYVVSGTSPAKIMASPGILTTTNPFYFEGMWAQRIKERYVIHNGFVTDCVMPKPWWTFSAPLFDVIPGERAIGHHTLFRIKKIPLFYLPVFYRPLGRHTRQSGFLTPNLGHSNQRGFMVGLGYYWAINRSYDMTYNFQYFSSLGTGHAFDFRGKPNDVSDFNFLLYGVQDTAGTSNPNVPPNAGGFQFNITARTEFKGFTARLDYNYLSSYLFRQTFAQSFISAVFSEIDSTGFASRHFKNNTYALNVVFQRSQLFESVAQNDDVIVQKLPSVEFSSRDQQVVQGPVPVWVSFASSAGLLNRQEPVPAANGSYLEGINTGAVDRVDLEPRIMTAFNFKGFSVVPSLNVGATQYSNSWAVNSYAPTSQSGVCCGYPNPNYVLAGSGIFRSDINFGFELSTPSLERIYSPPKWLHLGKKLKHVIEARATYQYITGVNDFTKYIRFDETDLLADTNQLKISVINRLYEKDKNGFVREVFSWEIAQERYFNPSFGGVVLAGQRNVVLASVELTPFPFLAEPRNYSPIVSFMHLSPLSFITVDWRADYDPYYHKFVNNTITGGFRTAKYFLFVGESDISTNPLLIPSANQITLGGGYGNLNRRGWNVGESDNYDFLQRQLNFQLAQVAYNTDCCGFSVEFRRFSFGSRNENQFLMSLTLANIGMFGSLQKQERLF